MVTQNPLDFDGNRQLATGSRRWHVAAVEQNRIQEKGHGKVVSQRCLFVAHRGSGRSFSKRLLRVLVVIDRMCRWVTTCATSTVLVRQLALQWLSSSYDARTLDQTGRDTPDTKAAFWKLSRTSPLSKLARFTRPLRQPDTARGKVGIAQFRWHLALRLQSCNMLVEGLGKGAPCAAYCISQWRTSCGLGF